MSEELLSNGRLSFFKDIHGTVLNKREQKTRRTEKKEFRKKLQKIDKNIPKLNQFQKILKNFKRIPVKPNQAKHKRKMSEELLSNGRRVNLIQGL